MAVQDFVSKLKADGSEKDERDLDKVLADYKKLSAKLSQKDRGSFSLNVLCILCRNLDKVPSWCQGISQQSLLTLSVECARHAAVLDRPDNIRTLACLYHLHRYSVRQASSAPPELVLKVSYLAFECTEKTIIKEHCKTYWSIISDRLTYIEKLKTNRVTIIKLLPKLTEDIAKVVRIYDSVSFCNNILVTLVKKLCFIYGDRNAKELSPTFKIIIDALMTESDKDYKSLNEKETAVLYHNLLETFYTCADNSAKCNFKDVILYDIAKSYTSMIGHSTELKHCMQTFFLNILCNVMTENISQNLLETTFSSLLMSCETTEKLGYNKTMMLTYPHLNQVIRLFIEYLTNNDKLWKLFTLDAQENCLKVISLLLDKLKDTEQLLKCEKCTVKTGLHDAVRLSFAAKHFITLNVERKINVTSLLNIYIEVVEKQYIILSELNNLCCINIEKCIRKIQTDVHNTAILLNKTSILEQSIILFDLYLNNEIKYNKHESDLKNISRGYYNKSICEVDMKDLNGALNSAYLSFVFGYPETLKSEKSFSLVIDVKSKMLKATDEDTEKQDTEQMITVLSASKVLVNDTKYDLKRYLKRLSFGACLHNEVTTYLKLWPSLSPVVGCIRDLVSLMNEKQPDWVQVNPASTSHLLAEAVILCANKVRTVRGDAFNRAVNETKLLMAKIPDISAMVCYAACASIQVEISFIEAADKHGWRNTNLNADWYDTCTPRTFQQEYEALKYCHDAVIAWTRLLKYADKLKQCKFIVQALRILQVLSARLLTIRWEACALQLAHVACRIADVIGDGSIYLTSVMTIMEYTNDRSDGILSMMGRASSYVKMLGGGEYAGLRGRYACDCALWCLRTEQLSSAVRLVQYAQATLVTAIENKNDPDLDLAVGRLMEVAYAISRLQKQPVSSQYGCLSTVTNIHRHYLAADVSGPDWCSRRHRSLVTQHRRSRSALVVIDLCVALGLIRRAHSAVSSCSSGSGAAWRARGVAAALCTDVTDEAQVVIEDRLLHILGVSPPPTVPKKQPIRDVAASNNLETMLERRPAHSTSPTPIHHVAQFRQPAFFSHKNCQCCQCVNPSCVNLACQTYGLKASVHFRAGQFNTAEEFFDGTFKSIQYAKIKLDSIMVAYKSLGIEGYIIDIVGDMYERELLRVSAEIHLEASYFELERRNFEKVDQYVVRIHEILEEVKASDAHLRHEVLSLMCACAKVRNVEPTRPVTSLEVEMEGLRLSPQPKEIPKTPEQKLKKPPKVAKPKLVVHEDEIPNAKRKVIKLNLDENDESHTQVVEKRVTRKKSEIPVPVTSKPLLEDATPRPKRKPRVFGTENKR